MVLVDSSGRFLFSFFFAESGFACAAHGSAGTTPQIVMKASVLNVEDAMERMDALVVRMVGNKNEMRSARRRAAKPRRHAQSALRFS
jgi:hypothetical protein